MNCCLISDFPRTVAINLLSQWLSLRDLGHLDCAMCGERLRKVFLSRISDEYFVSADDSSDVSADCLKWMIDRNIKVHRLSLSCVIDPHETVEYFLRLNKLKELVLLTDLSGYDTRLLRNATELERFEVCVDSLNGGNILCLLELVGRLPNLCSLHVGSYDIVPDNGDEEDSEDCASLNSDSEYSASTAEDEQEDVEYDLSDDSDDDCDYDVENDPVTPTSEERIGATDETSMDRIVRYQQLVPVVCCEKLTSFSCTHLQLTDLMLSLVVCMSPNLANLDIEGCHFITDLSMPYVARYCKHLKKLNVNNCTQITKIGLLVIAEGCRDLEEFQMTVFREESDFTSDDMESIAMQCQHMRVFNVRFTNPTDTVWSAIGNNNVIERLTATINQLDIERILRVCHSLKELSLIQVYYSIAMDPFDLSIVFPLLTVLRLEGWECLKDAHVLGLTRMCPNLISLDVSYCCSLTDEAFESVAEVYGTKLKKLGAAGCQITNITALSISNRTLALEWLDISCCDLLDIQSVVRLVQKLAALSLTFVNLSGVGRRQYTSEIERLAYQFSALTINYCCGWK